MVTRRRYNVRAWRGVTGRRWSFVLYQKVRQDNISEDYTVTLDYFPKYMTTNFTLLSGSEKLKFHCDKVPSSVERNEFSYSVHLHPVTTERFRV